MTSDELAETVAECRASSISRNMMEFQPDVARIQAAMLAEIAYQLALANERAAPRPADGAAYYEYGPAGLPVRKPL
jgi:hypothetical protein